MGRILAIDYGQKRVGLAVTDALRICAHPLDTIHVAKLETFILNYIAKEEVDVIVVGEPKTLSNVASDSSRFIEPFINRLKKILPNMKIERMDERFTSKIAFQTMIEAGLQKKKRGDKALVDKISATIILQSYLQKLELESFR